MNQITMPQAGQSMEEGTIVRWLKAEGDSVVEGEVLLEVETDKATVEVESTAGGTLRKILVLEGETVPVLTPIAILAEADEDISAASAQEPAPAAPAAETPAPASAPEGAVTPILMPQAGQSMEEGTIVKWHVGPGDAIEKGQIIFDVETDKATVEVEATDAGKLARILLDEGEMTEVLQPVALLAESDADAEAWLASSPAAGAAPVAAAVAVAASTSAPAMPATAPAAKTATGRIKASPAARKAARDRGIDLAAVGAGSGPGGRIVMRDVESAQPAAASASAPTRKRMSGMRKAIARNLSASKQNIPHFYIRLTIDADPLFRFYREQKAKYPCSVNDVITLACARMIMEFPPFRMQIDGDELIDFPSANIGIAVGMDEGLVVPVLQGAERLTLQQAGAEVRRLVEGARGGKVEGMGKGVFTITNLGMFGVEEFTAIINPPEAAILAVSAIREEVVVSDGAMRAGRVMTMTLSVDHRIIDGLVAAKFLARLKEILEAPEQLVM